MTRCRNLVMAQLVVGLLLLRSLAMADGGTAHSIVDLTFEQLMAMISNLGLGAIIFAVWLHGLKRQTAMESLVGKYNEVQASHLQAFTDISAAYRRLAEENQKTMLMYTQVNQRLVDKLDQLLREHEQRRVL